MAKMNIPLLRFSTINSGQKDKLEEGQNNLTEKLPN